jgi:hypothetical protein
MKLVVLGAGPTGISVINELLLNGISPGAITIVDSRNTNFQSKKTTTTLTNSNSILGTVLRERQNKGLGKNGQSLSDDLSLIQSPSSRWGVSCFPPLGWGIGSDSFSLEEIRSSYTKVSTEWQIQAESNPDKDFELSGEVLGGLKRKQLSLDLVKAGYGHHSRLAISTSGTSLSIGCKLNSNCFAGCPNSAPWNPDREISLLKTNHPEINICHQKITGIVLGERFLVGSKHDISYDKLFLGIGANQTRDLVQPLFERNVLIENSPVVMVPLITKKSSSDNDYSKSFLFTDLVVPVIRKKKILSLLQIYLPTKEITGRVITQLPRFVHRLLAKELLGVFRFIFRRIGVGMIFFESTSTQIDELDKKVVKEMLSAHKNLLKNSGIILLPFFKRFLLNGASYHIGAIHFEGENMRGIDSQLYKDLAAHNVFITDTSALPFLPPGPHTATAAALAKLIVKREMQWL